MSDESSKEGQEPQDESKETAPVPVNAESAIEESTENQDDSPAFVQKAELPSLASNFKGPSDLKIAPLMEVDLNVSVILGKKAMTLGELLQLGPGSVVELNRSAGEPIEVLVNDRFFAKGEIVVVNESFGVRISEIVETQKAVAA